MSDVVIALTVVGIAEAAALWFVVRGLRRLDRVESRLSHLTDALTLLAETAESGFRANGLEIARIAERAVATPAAARTATRRMASAVKKGRSVPDIAADEQVSEGEVNLRLHLAAAQAAARSKARRPKGAGNAALCS
jgi:hypothetical protein